VDANDKDVDNVNIIIDVDETNAWFHGKVTEKSETGNPVGSALIVAENSDRIVVSETDEQGDYKLEGFKDEETATISMPVFPGTKESADASNDGTEVNLVVNQGYTVSGTVTDSNDDDSAITGATVYLKDDNGQIAGLPVKSDSSGNFRLTDVASDVYTLNSVHPSYKKYTDDLDVSGDITGLSVSMDPGAWIEGTVDDGTDPLQDAMIVALTSGKSYVTATDQDGEYEIAGLVDGKGYELFAEKQGHEPKHTSVTADTIPETVQNFTMPEVSDTYTVDGTITEDGGSNVADGTEVILYSTEVNAYMKTTTNSEGDYSYSFSDVMGADGYNLLIRRDGKPTVKEPIGMVDGDIFSKDVTIDESQTISGTVDLSDNLTGKTVKVYLVNKSEDVLQTLEATDAGNGNYEYIFTVRTGVDYKIAAFCEGYDVQWYDSGADFSNADFVTAGNTADISLSKP